jgi:hypothetical protein
MLSGLFFYLNFVIQKFWLIVSKTKNSKISQIYTREKKPKNFPLKNPNDKLFNQHFIDTLFTELGHHYGARRKNVSKLWEARNEGENNNNNNNSNSNK